MTKPIHIAASNIQGLGALQLVQSLLPALAATRHDRIGTVFVPEAGSLAALSVRMGFSTVKLARYLPNAISRVSECVFSRRYYPSDGNLLVLGDVPLNLPVRQVVLVHRPHLVSGRDTGSAVGNAKVAVSRMLFSRNAKHIHRAIVQSDVVRDELENNFPQLGGRIMVIPQPAPQWLENTATRNSSWDGISPLRLLYPASAYPHKNHNLLRRYARHFGNSSDAKFLLTLNRTGADWTEMLTAIGLQTPEGMRNQYSHADALVFPSLAESYGLPLVEAMTLGLPILAADRPYARSLCGDAAIYFDPLDISSLNLAIAELGQRMRKDWVPDYTNRLALIPRDWHEVAERTIALFDSV